MDRGPGPHSRACVLAGWIPDPFCGLESRARSKTVAFRNYGAWETLTKKEPLQTQHFSTAISADMYVPHKMLSTFLQKTTRVLASQHAP